MQNVKRKMQNNSIKPKIIFSPMAYIAQLKHVERFIPYLKDKYDIGFLFIGKHSSRRQEVIEYCNKKGYEFYVIEEGFVKDQKVRIPIITPLWERYLHSKACRKFLDSVNPQKIITTRAIPSADTILKEANRKGTDTIVLQWSGSALRRAALLNEKPDKTLVRKLHDYLLKIISNILDIPYKEPRFGLAPANPAKMGVFDDDEAKNGLGRHHDSGTVHIVGSPDFQFIDELKQKIDSKPSLKKQLLDKYDLSENKLKILIILFRYYRTPPDKYKMTISEHVAHYYEVLKKMREVFSESEADIMLKIHPGEYSEGQANIYESYKKLGIKLYVGQSKTDELLCLSDLCITEPQTSVNYMILASNTPAIFLNMHHRTDIDKLAPFFGIKHIVKKEDDFVNLLQQFKDGELPKQYDNSDIELKSVDNAVELINR